MPPDSYNYLEAANNNDFINIWPIGYSKFLQLVGIFSHSHLVVIIIQYLFLQISLLYFLFTIRYLFVPGKWLFRIILTITTLNPLMPHIANFISSDCLFTAISIIWFTQLLWALYKPNLTLLLSHSIVLLFAFTIRHNALYFPLISATIIILSNLQKRSKWISIMFISILILGFIGRTQYEYHKKTGMIQYTAFGGWQMAANALYGYAYAKLDNLEDIPVKFKELHRLVNQHMDSLKNLTVRPDQEVGIYYLWDFKSPLRVYMDNLYKHDTINPFFNKWAALAPLYASYGRYIIARHPKEYLKYYAWPNLQRYYTPPSYFMGIYNMGYTKVDPIAVLWFNWKNNSLPHNSTNNLIPIADIFTILSPVINLIFLTGFLSFLFLGGFKNRSQACKKVILFTLITWIINMLFSVLSAPIELRYQLFPLIISSAWAFLFVAYVIKVIHTFPQNLKSNEQAVLDTVKA
jgi:hypothetical protein